MQNFFNNFWKKYEKHYNLYLGITTGLFLLQIIHLYWLITHVVLYRLWGTIFFSSNYFWQLVIILVDYTEIPAIITVSILYIYSLQQRWNKKDLLFLVLLNSQWLHLFWISDEFVINLFRDGNTSTILPFWFAWVAIGIDYLELPIMYDTTRKFIKSISKNRPTA